MKINKNHNFLKKCKERVTFLITYMLLHHRFTIKHEVLRLLVLFKQITLSENLMSTWVADHLFILYVVASDSATNHNFTYSVIRSHTEVIARAINYGLRVGNAKRVPRLSTGPR